MQILVAYNIATSLSLQVVIIVVPILAPLSHFIERHLPSEPGEPIWASS